MLGAAAPAHARGCKDARARAASASIERLADAIACLVNRERRHKELAPLDVSRRLGVAAYLHAADMRDHRYFSHTSADGRSFVDRVRAARYLEGRETARWTLGETLAWSPERTATPADFVVSLMNSGPHRRVILDARHRELGIGLVRGTPNGHEDGATLAIDYGSLESPERLRSEPPSEQRGRKTERPGKPGKTKKADPPAEPQPAHPEQRPEAPGKPDKEHPRKTPRRVSGGEMQMSSVIASWPSSPDV